MIKTAALTATLLAALLPTAALAQVPYLITEEPDPYVSRFNGTFVNFFDFNNGDAVVSLPFPFRYFLNTYTEVNVGVNGLVAFGEPATASANVSFPASAAPNNVIGLFWEDLWAGDVTTYVEGTAPNRTFIIQWRNMQTAFFFGETFEMQLWLHEGNDGRFELHYGPSRGLQNPPVAASFGFENETGDRGINLRSCNPSCVGNEFISLQDIAIKATLEGGTDVAALGINVNLRGDPIQIYQAIPFDVTGSIASFHGEALGPFTYSVYLLGQNELAPSTPPLFTSSEINLGPYELLEVSTPVTAPVDVTPGRYRVAIEVDSSGQIDEPLETNNLAIGSQILLVGARAADLRISNVQPAPGTIGPGSTLDVTVEIQNAGNLEADAEYRVVLSQNRAPSVNDVIIGVSASPEELPIASEPVERTVSVTIPANIQAGRYYIGAVIDPLNTVVELNETNNTARTDNPIQIEIGTVGIDTTSLPVAYVGLAYQTKLVAKGGNGSYTWELIGGDLPAGLTFSAPTGEVLGTPTEVTSKSLTFRVNSNTLSAEKTLMLETREIGGPLTIVNRTLLTGVVGQAYPPAEANQDPSTQQRITAVGGAGAATFTLVGGAPTGLTLDADGYLHGVPVGRGLYSLEITATDGTNSTTRNIPLTIVEPGRLSLIVGAVPEATLGEPYSYELFTVGRTMDSTLRYEVIDAAAAPPGLTVGSDGFIAGTPTLAGLFTFGVRVIEGTGANAPQDTASVSILVTPGSNLLSITPDTLPDAVVGVEYSVTFEARQGLPPFVWTVENPGGLPPGLTIETIEIEGVNRLRLSGTPTDLPGESQLGTNTGGVVSFLVRLNDAQGRRAEQSASLRVLPAPVVDPNANDDGGCGCTSTATGASSPLFAGLFLAIAGLAIASLRRK